MDKVWRWCLSVVVVLVLLGPRMPHPTAAASVAPVESGVYEEDFSTYAAKEYTEGAVWDIWSSSLRLERSDGAAQNNAVIAMDGSGNTVVVWADSRNGNYDIYAQRLDSSGNRLWAQDTRVNSDSGTVDQGYPAVAMDGLGNAVAVAVDGSGNAIVVWWDDRSGDYDIYAQRLDEMGNRLWVQDIRVNYDSAAAYQWYPAVTMDGSGNAMVVWGDNRNSNYDIYAQRLDANGGRLWAQDTRVNSDSGTAGQWNPAVVMDSSDNAVVVWTDHRNDNNDIYAQRLNSSGSRLWTQDTRVNSDGGTADQGYSAVAVDGSGTAVVTWWDDRNGNRDIYAQRMAVSGNRLWVQDVRVNSDSGTADQWHSAVAVDGSSDAVVVWTDYQNVYAQQLDAMGNLLWTQDVRVNSDSGMAYFYSYDPAVAVDASGNTVVDWKDGRNSGSDIYAQRLDGSGNRLWVRDTRVNYDSGTAGQWSPTVAMVGSSNAVVMWSDGRNGNRDIYALRLDGNGNQLWAQDVRVNSDSGTIGLWSPEMAVDGNDNAVVVWTDERNGNNDIYAQRLDASGNRLWVQDVRVNSDSGPANQEYPTVVVDVNDNALVVWTDERNGNNDIYAQRLDASGNRLWAQDVRVDSDSGIADQWFPAAAVDGIGNAAVVWKDDRNGNRDIYAQWLDAGGSRLWTQDVRVNSDSGTIGQWPHAVAINGSDDAVVVWEDSRNGNTDIYAQRLDASGNRLWIQDVRVNSDGGTASQWYSAVAVDGSNNAVVAWTDVRNEDRDIYMQRLDASGNRLWMQDVRVNSDNGTTDQGYPAAAVDGSGNAFVVWGDLRNGNADVYAQRINQVGGKVWLADLQVVYPDVFHFPTGIVESRTVDTLAANLTWATLNTDIQTNGGSVQFSLSNDGGATWTTVTSGVTHVFTTTGSDLRWRAELTGDPIWRRRTPVVDSLRIEYSTQVPYADDYEPDDTCAQAKRLAVNGAVQAHTFYQQADEDWAWFDVISGTTYIVQTSNTQANADTELELRAACPQPPFAEDANSFGHDARITWQATFSGPVYVKVTHHDPVVYGAETGYDLSVRTFAQTPVAVIIAGHDNSYSLQSNIDAMADMAYRIFLDNGIPKGNLRYFGPNPARDVDGNGLNDDIYATVTITAVRETVQDWAREQGVQLGVPFYVYLVDHGHYDEFLAAGSNQRIGAADLNLWLSNLEATSGADNINVILEACKSGSFIDVTALGPAEVSGHNRVVIASTSSTLDAYASTSGGYFSDAFWTAVGENQDLRTAFEVAKQAVQLTELSQHPWLDDNGDAVADERDGALALERGLGDAFTRSPVIDWAQAEEADGQAVVQAQVRDDFGVGRVWAEVYAPDFVEPEPSQDGTTPELDVPTTTLTLAGSDLYGATYPLTQTGRYRLVVYAMDDEGYRALPQVTQLCSGCTYVYLPLVLRGK